jgi:hypothetical protein
MAQKMLVQLVDDLDGTSSDDVSTVLFGLDGVTYEIDLHQENAERFRKIFTDYVEAARRTGGRLKRGKRPGEKSADNGEAGQIRQWAIENGFELSARGRIPSHVIEAYGQAQLAPAKPAPKRRASAKKA